AQRVAYDSEHVRALRPNRSVDALVAPCVPVVRGMPDGFCRLRIVYFHFLLGSWRQMPFPVGSILRQLRIFGFQMLDQLLAFVHDTHQFTLFINAIAPLARSTNDAQFLIFKARLSVWPVLITGYDATTPLELTSSCGTVFSCIVLSVETSMV